MAFAIRHATTGVVPLVSLLGLLLVSFYLLGVATESAARFEQQYLWLLLFNLGLLIALVLLIVINVITLVRQALARKPGARLTVRLMAILVLLALIPVTIVYIFSVRLLERSIESWFDVRVEYALEEALELSRASLDVLMRQLKQQTQPMAQHLADIPDTVAPPVVHTMQRDSGAREMTLFNESHRVIATSSEASSSILPQLPGETILNLAYRGDAYIGLDPINASTFQVRLVFRVSKATPGREARFLQVLYPLSPRISQLAQGVEDASQQYRALVYLRKPLKESFVLALSLVLLLGTLFAVWAAFFVSRKLVAPIRKLAEGTKAVAAGDLTLKLPVTTKDDLGLLVMSFNEMTAHLAQARDTAKHSQRLLENQHAYLEALLENLSSGVLSVDSKFTLRTANAAASHILGLDLERYVGHCLTDIATEHPLSTEFWSHLHPRLQDTAPQWEEQVVLLGTRGRTILILRGVKLPARGHLGDGHVIVFDDITTLIRAQRDAAWAEVARRLAHEIKNPLTPIQLCTERLQHKLLARLPTADAQILERAAHTIIQQVESMKTMVNAFGDYARPPSMASEPIDLHRLIADTAELYLNNATDTALILKLNAPSPYIAADPVRMRQVLHNLIKNALEALASCEQRKLVIKTQMAQAMGADFVEIILSDNGPGFSAEILERAFEPYVTSKPKGTGLGLAMVKKIVEEHGGLVEVGNNLTGGARVSIRLPVADVYAHEPHPHEPAIRSDVA